MGVNDSKVYLCSYCASSIKSIESSSSSSSDEKSAVSCISSSDLSSSQLISLPRDTLLCARCHGFYRLKASEACMDERCIEHIHICPFIDAIKSDDDKEMESEHLIATYLKPYFRQHRHVLIRSGDRLMIGDVEFKVFGCFPPKGYIDYDETQFHLNGNDGGLIKLKYENMETIHCLPMKASLETAMTIYDDINETILNISSDSIKRRHLCKGETFICRGIQWRVMESTPQNGIIQANTKIVCDGKPIQDLQKISLRPIYESIPNAHRNFTPKQIKTHYLDPFFKGNNRYIGETREISMFGVTFAIRESIPASGVVTMNTQIDYMGCCIKLKQLETMQEMEDMEMAHKLHKDMEDKIARERAARRRELRGRLRGRWDDPLGFDIGFEFPWNQEEQQKQKKCGVDMDIVDRLPTFTFLNNSKNREDQCRICLEYYIDGDDLRILPCFHIYHKACVDTWLTKMSAKCPICKTSIIRQRQQR